MRDRALGIQDFGAIDRVIQVDAYGLLILPLCERDTPHAMRV